MPPRFRLLFSRRHFSTSTPSPAPELTPRPTDPALLLRLCTILYQHQHAPDDKLHRRLSALPLPTAPADIRELFLQASARFPLSWRPVHRLLAHLSTLHHGASDGSGGGGFPHSPATAARLLDVLAKSGNIDLLHSTLFSLPRSLLSAAALRAAVRGLAPAREVGKVAALVTLFPECHRARVLTFVTDVACSEPCRLPDVAEKVIKRAEHRHGVARTGRCCDLLVVAYCRAGSLAEACKVWNGMERRVLEPGAAAYREIVVTMFKNNRVADAMRMFDGMRRSGVPDDGGCCCRAVVSWLCKEGRVWGAYMVFAEMVKIGVEVDGEVLGDLVYALMARRRVREGYRVFHGVKEKDISLYHGLMKGLLRIKRAGEATEVFREMIDSGCEPNMHTYIMLLQGHLGKRGRKGRDPLVNFETIFVGGLVKAGRTLEATKFVERTMWGGVDVPRFDYNKFLYYFSDEEGAVMFEEVSKRLKEVGSTDLADILSAYGARMATRDRRRRATNGLLISVQDVSCQSSSESSDVLEQSKHCR
ncbi:hypothetical protein BS78_02G340000 [Paspalum vaginatum]|nr:hypothetical protein BS78_02G340000 [Paspalum vaginatum]KAJ1291747.1 hypothetical protein BS78_02G340000 [Paspalum vaginatum]KAJ1291748.1 hypothetical protein BS78_02G340000 [Paspalum vaginatum]KAJ1291749.1 hypothetical protein BS78_02G340000 [Paspalum vaginatum]